MLDADKTHRCRPYDVPANEERRLAALAEYGLTDTPPEPEFDEIGFLAARALRTPVALVSLVGSDRQFFKAAIGTTMCETSREVSFCNYAVLSGDVVVILDATRDPRVANNALVTAPPGIRFYAGAPLTTSEGHVIGSVCAIDFEPRAAVSDDDIKALRFLAAQTMRQMELRRLARLELESQVAEQHLARSEERFRLLVDGITDYAIYLLDPQGRITNWNAGAERMKGYNAAEVAGTHFSRFYTPDDQDADLPARALETALSSGRFEDEGLRVRKDGSRFWANVVIEPVRDPDGGLIGFAKITRDITERRNHQRRLEYLAHFDTLTGLPNRVLLQERLEQALAVGAPTSVMLMDLDGFKEVNDTLGHAAGDFLLKEAGMRLRATIGGNATLGRLGGDEFAAILPAVCDPLILSGLCQKLLEAFRSPFVWEGDELYLGLSIGISISSPGDSGDSLIVHADIALYSAKEEGRGGYSFFEPRMRQVILNRRNCESDLRDAVARSELELFYQPQVRLEDRALVGAEALLRWNRPGQGVLSPAAFLPVLERSALAATVGRWALRTACQHAAEARASGCPQYRVAVNLFEAQFRKGCLIGDVEDALAEAGIPPQALELEITENIILRHDTAVLELLTRLRDMGVTIAFDDYGTGYASLSILKRFPLSVLKIDRQFVRDLAEGNSDAAVVRAILYLGKSFGLQVIAEGIETADQERLLRALGCCLGQGYLYGRPAPASAVMRLITQGRTLPALGAG